MKINNLSQDNPNTNFKSLRFNRVHYGEKQIIRKNLGKLRELAKDCDINITSNFYKRPGHSFYDKGYDISYKPLKETDTFNKNIDDYEVKSVYIPEREETDIVSHIKANVEKLKKGLKNLK